MRRKCFNCAEAVKQCQPDINPECELRVPMIWQLIEPGKIDGLQRCLQSLKMRIEPVGKDDFTIEMA